MAKRMAYFSDVSGALIDEGKRAILTVKRPDGTTVVVEGSEDELRVQTPPKREQQLASVRVTYPGQREGKGGKSPKRKDPISYKVPVGTLRQILPTAVINAIGLLEGSSPAAPRTKPRGEQAAGEFVCPECERRFTMRRGLTRHLREGHKMNDRQVEQTMEQVEGAMAGAAS